MIHPSKFIIHYRNSFILLKHPIFKQFSPGLVGNGSCSTSCSLFSNSSIVSCWAKIMIMITPPSKRLLTILESTFSRFFWLLTIFFKSSLTSLITFFFLILSCFILHSAMTPSQTLHVPPLIKFLVHRQSFCLHFIFTSKRQLWKMLTGWVTVSTVHVRDHGLSSWFLGCYAALILCSHLKLQFCKLVRCRSCRQNGEF